MKFPASIAPLFSLWLLAGCDTETPVEEATREGILLYASGAEPKGLDGQLTSGVSESKVLTSLFEGLCGDHPSEDNTMVPGAAASWEHNEDMTQWTFHLQPEGRWSDGKPVTTDDFLFSYRRMLNPRLAAQYAGMLHVIKNAQAYNQDQRGYLLCGLDEDFPTPWQELETINFRGNPDIENETLEKLKERGFDDLNTAEKRIWIEGRGLDRVDKPVLQSIRKDPSLFEWPEDIPEATRGLVLDRLIAHIDQGEPDLYEQAEVGIEAPDSHTLIITLGESVPYLPAMTRHTSWFPVPKHVVLEHGKIHERFTEWSELENIVGNGPFKLVEWRFNHYIEVERNPYYWDAENVGLNGIKFFPITNFYTETRAFLAGQLHTTYSLPSELLQWARKNHAQYLRVEPYVGTRYLRFNTRREGLDQMKVRQALSLALDRKKLCEYVFEGFEPAISMTPEMGNYEPPDVLEYDLDKAKKLLAEAGYAGGKGLPRYKILTTSINPSVEAVQEAFKQLGIGIDVEQKAFGPYVTAQHKGDYDIAMAGWIGDYPDPTTFLDMWTRGNGHNNTGWSSEEYESLLREATRISDPDERARTLAKAERILLKEAPIAPIAYYTRLY
ncbi:MAG: peptide ABC transporter substrate-binding protein, partial [Akkermansiaceae bacterium]|nr:peptide ABC transporter substrate-binding protein [Akkermansiaceae bacterium]